MRWESLDRYALRDWLAQTATVVWEAKSHRWTLVQARTGEWFVLDCRFPWSTDAIPTWVTMTVDGPLWRTRSRVPAYVLRAVERHVPSPELLADAA